MSRVEKLLVVIILAGVAAAAYVGMMRWQVEAANRSVALVLDWQEVESLAAAGGVSVPDALSKLRAAGATDVALREQHLSDLVATGEMSVLPPDAAGASAGAPLSAPAIVLSAYDAATAERLRMFLAAKLPPHMGVPAGSSRAPSSAESPLLIPVPTSERYLETVGLGWPPDYPDIAQAAGLGVVARMDNYPGAPRQAIPFMVAQAAVAGARLVIFTGDQVLGYPGLAGETAATLHAAGVNYGSVEMAAQLGDAAMGRKLDGELVRVHSIVEAEMLTLSPPAVIARYVRAVRERGIRACYVRLFLAPREDPLGFNLRYLGALRREIQDAGYRTGVPRPLEPVESPPWALMLMAAAAVAAAVFALGRVAPLPGWVSAVLLLAGLAFGAALFQAAPHLFRAEKALLVALAFPSLGLIAVARGARSASGHRAVAPPASGRPLSSGALAARAAAWLIGASVVSAAGGLLVAGLLSERLFMSKVLSFAGVKLALSIPVVVVIAVWTLGLYTTRDWGGYRRRVQESFQRAWNRPIYVWEALLAAVLVAAAAVALMRSGNQPAVEVSGLELRLRDLLERALIARPRTKEFLFGHPALMLAMAMALRGRTRWVLALLVLGAVGQTSLVNTFCHVHTPLLISLVRSANGLWAGLVLGAIVVYLWDRLGGARPALPAGETVQDASAAAASPPKPDHRS